jgi:putative flippase GtrA
MGQKVAVKIPYKKLSSFIGVGVFNTIFNVLLFDMLIFLFSIANLVANFVSLLISILISYFLNKILVFKDESQANTKQLLKFFAGTFALQLVAQHLAVWLLGEKYTWIGRASYSLLNSAGIHFSKEFVILNTAKGLGVIFSIALSYLFYDKLIFPTKKLD